MQTAEFPKTIEEFMDSNWPIYVKAFIRSFRLNEDVDDTFQDFVAMMLKKKYVERWDASKGGSFSNWIFTAAKNFCLVKLKRSRSRGGKAIEGAVSLENTLDDGPMFRDMIPLSATKTQKIDTSLRMQEVEEILKDPKYRAYSHYETFDRDLLTIFRLMVIHELEPKQVACVLGTSPQWIYEKLKILRKIVSEVFDIGL